MIARRAGTVASRRSRPRIRARAAALGALIALGLVPAGGGVARAAGYGVTVSLLPESIAADGASHSTVTVKVSPALPGQQIELYAPFDHQISFGPVRDSGNGTYTATLTGSRNAEVTQIFAADALGTGEAFPATLTQVGATATSVTAVTNQPVTSSNPPVTNEGVVLFATVTSLTDNLASPNGTISLENGGSPIAGCESLPAAAHLSAWASVTCDASFAAKASPAELTAVFTPGAGLPLSGSTSPAVDFPVTADSTSISLTTASPPAVGRRVTYLARITADHTGALAPTGFVRFFDHGTVIGSCEREPLDASSTARCTITYRRPRTRPISASYSGDANFQSSESATVAASPEPLGTVDASMQWRFYYTRAATRLLQLVLSRAPLGARVSISCHGGGCRFRRRALAVRAPNRCGPGAGDGCASSETADLTREITESRLRPRARLTVAITKPGWTGKAYVFTVRAALPPTVQIGCTAPGSNRIAASC